jgi:hypothetical protein
MGEEQKSAKVWYEMLQQQQFRGPEDQLAVRQSPTTTKNLACLPSGAPPGGLLLCSSLSSPQGNPAPANWTFGRSLCRLYTVAARLETVQQWRSISTTTQLL